MPDLVLDTPPAVQGFNPFETVEITDKKLDAPVVVDEVAKPLDEVKPEAAIVADVKPVIAETPKPEPIKFANEFSEKFFEALKEGKEDELYSYLNEKKTLESVDKLSPEDQIKLNLKYEHKEYTPEEIEDLYAETYSKPEKPEQAADELDEEYAERITKWEKKSKSFENKLSRGAKEAFKNLQSKKSELVLPEIQKAATEPTPEELAQMDKSREIYLQSIDKGVSEFSGFNTVLKDGSVEIPISYSISDEEKSQLKPILQKFDVNDFYRERWLKPDNSWDGKQFSEDVYFLLNRDKIMQKVANEAGSQRLAKHIAEQKNIDFSGGRQQNINASAKSENEKMAEFFFGAR